MDNQLLGAIGKAERVALNKKSRSAATALFNAFAYQKSWKQRFRCWAMHIIFGTSFLSSQFKDLRVRNEDRYHEALEDCKVSLALIFSEPIDPLTLYSKRI